MRKLRFYADPGHSWLRVPLSELGSFIPSQYSYRGERYAYLEEDCDAPGWLASQGCLIAGRVVGVEFETRHVNQDSHIRRMPRFDGIDNNWRAYIGL